MIRRSRVRVPVGLVPLSVPLFVWLSVPLFLGAVALAACDDLPLVGGSTELRLENGSELDMSEVVVFLPEERLTADELPAGERTPYREVARAYRIATVDGKVEGEPFHIQVIDYVGEEPLGDGRFTYVLEVYAAAPPGVSLRLRRD